MASAAAYSIHEVVVDHRIPGFRECPQVQAAERARGVLPQPRDQAASVEVVAAGRAGDARPRLVSLAAAAALAHGAPVGLLIVRCREELRVVSHDLHHLLQELLGAHVPRLSTLGWREVATHHRVDQQRAAARCSEDEERPERGTQHDVLQTTCLLADRVDAVHISQDRPKPDAVSAHGEQLAGLPHAARSRQGPQDRDRGQAKKPEEHAAASGPRPMPRVPLAGRHFCRAPGAAIVAAPTGAGVSEEEARHES
mmetsp:Transcript_14246/g.42471  ORF Transcript_14246/g.42471 Transcript_14246/m.42471 type:complete len:254 (+) Transcript_14246:93-854(+)